MSAKSRFEHSIKLQKKNGALKREREQNISQLKEQINLLGWDYDRMSSSGQLIYDRIESLLRKI